MANQMQKSLQENFRDLFSIKIDLKKHSQKKEEKEKKTLVMYLFIPLSYLHPTTIKSHSWI